MHCLYLFNCLEFCNIVLEDVSKLAPYMLQGFRDWGIIMGACASSPYIAIKPSKSIKGRRKYYGRSKKRHSVVDGNRKRNSDAGARVTDFAVSEFVHTTTTCRRSAVSNSTFQLTQVQWHHSQIDVNGIFSLLKLNFFGWTYLSEKNHTTKGNTKKWSLCYGSKIILTTLCRHPYLIYFLYAPCLSGCGGV